MIRSTVNQTIKRTAKDPLHLSQSYELVLGGVDEANAVTIELQESDPSPPAFHTTLPSDSFNGVRE